MAHNGPWESRRQSMMSVTLTVTFEEWGIVTVSGSHEGRGEY